jgi:hypothetical protein
MDGSQGCRKQSQALIAPAIRRSGNAAAEGRRGADPGRVQRSGEVMTGLSESILAWAMIVGGVAILGAVRWRPMKLWQSQHSRGGLRGLFGGGRK